MNNISHYTTRPAGFLLYEFKEFEMDPEIKKELSRQTQEKIDTVKKELAWDSEKQQIALDKLKMRLATDP